MVSYPAARLSKHGITLAYHALAAKDGQGGDLHIPRWNVFTLARRNICMVLVVALIGVTSITLLACQWHVPPSGHEHSTPFTHHHGSSGHATSGASCLLAVLPTVIGLTGFLLAWLADSPSRWQSALVVLQPFIPPRQPWRSSA